MRKALRRQKNGIGKKQFTGTPEDGRSRNYSSAREEAKAVIRMESSGRRGRFRYNDPEDQKTVTFRFDDVDEEPGTAMKILKDGSREDDGWTLKIWQIMMSRKNLEIHREAPDDER